MALIRQIAAITAARYGVNILEVTPAGTVQGVGTNIVAVVGEFPWGPETQLTQVSGAGLFETFCPLVFGVENTTPAMKAFIEKTFPSVVKIARVPAASAAAAAKTFQGAGAVDSVLVTAKYKGAVGNLISVTWTANATVAANRDALVTVTPAGATVPTYSAFYPNVAVAGTPIVVTDPGDPYVVFSRVGSAAVVPTAAAATALTAGSNGTATAGNYRTAIDTLGDANEAWSTAFVAEPPDALVDAINTEVVSFFTASPRGYWAMLTPAAQTQAAAKTAVGTARTDRATYLWPKVQITNMFDENRPLVTVQMNSFAAVAIASVLPEQSPGGASGAPFLKGIKALEAGQRATDAELESLGDAGITPVFMSRALGPILYDACTTNIANTDLRPIERRRMTDFLTESIADFMVLDTGKPLDVDLVNRRLGPITGPRLAAVETFLDGLKGAFRIRNFDIEEFAGNVQANIDVGQWVIDVIVKYYGTQRQTILRVLAGPTVTITVN